MLLPRKIGKQRQTQIPSIWSHWRADEATKIQEEREQRELTFYKLLFPSVFWRSLLYHGKLRNTKEAMTIGWKREWSLWKSQGDQEDTGSILGSLCSQIEEPNPRKGNTKTMPFNIMAFAKFLSWAGGEIGNISKKLLDIQKILKCYDLWKIKLGPTKMCP